MSLSVGGGRVEALRMVDRQLSKGNFILALSLLKHFHRHPSPPALFGFAAATQVPRRVSSVEQLHLSVTETSTLHSLLDAILHPSNYRQVVQHEAGHFLVGYLLGVLPKQYICSTMEDKTADAHVKFLGFEFLKELEDVVLSNKNSHEIKAGHRARKHKLSSTVISKFACVIVGVSSRASSIWILKRSSRRCGESMFIFLSPHGKITNQPALTAFPYPFKQLNRVLKWQQLTEDEANNLTRWAVLNTLTILHSHTKARSTLAEALLHGRSIGSCIHVIEANLNHPV